MIAVTWKQQTWSQKGIAAILISHHYGNPLALGFGCGQHFPKSFDMPQTKSGRSPLLGGHMLPFEGHRRPIPPTTTTTTVSPLPPFAWFSPSTSFVTKTPFLIWTLQKIGTL